MTATEANSANTNTALDALPRTGAASSSRTTTTTAALGSGAATNNGGGGVGYTPVVGGRREEGFSPLTNNTNGGRAAGGPAASFGLGGGTTASASAQRYQQQQTAAVGGASDEVFVDRVPAAPRDGSIELDSTDDDDEGRLGTVGSTPARQQTAARGTNNGGGFGRDITAATDISFGAPSNAPHVGEHEEVDVTLMPNTPSRGSDNRPVLLGSQHSSNTPNPLRTPTQSRGGAADQHPSTTSAATNIFPNTNNATTNGQRSSMNFTNIDPSAMTDSNLPRGPSAVNSPTTTVPPAPAAFGIPTTTAAGPRLVSPTAAASPTNGGGMMGDPSAITSPNSAGSPTHLHPNANTVGSGTNTTPPPSTAAQVMAEERRRIAVETAERALAEGATPAAAVAAGVAAAAAVGGGSEGGGANGTDGGAESEGRPAAHPHSPRTHRPRVPNSQITLRPHVNYSQPLKVRQAYLLDSQWMTDGCEGMACCAPTNLFMNRCLIAQNCQQYYDDEEDCCRWIAVERPALLVAAMCALDLVTAGLPCGCFYHGCGTAAFGCWSRWMVRRKYRIEGFGWSDCLMYLCCVSCAGAQIRFELDNNMMATAGLRGPSMDVEMR